MPLDQQSVLPTVRGVPWWGAVLVATVITGIGAAIDASNTDALGAVFKFCYLVGCVAAALVVRRRALFTAAAQPPLIAFLVGVITLYGLNADQASSGLKSLIFKVLLPIANDFPWMALTFLVTLGLVLARWFLTRDRSGGGAGKRRARTSSKPAASGEAKTTAVKAPADGTRTPAKRAARPTKAKGQAAEPGRRQATAGTPEGQVRKSATKRPGPRSPGPKGPVPDAEARPTATDAATPARRSAGAVYRAEAGEQIDAADDPVDRPLAQAATVDARPPAAAQRRRVPAEHERYESVTRQTSTTKYPSTRARNRA
nr:DUF6542 domain-containing protein [Gordonia insulae]